MNADLNPRPSPKVQQQARSDAPRSLLKIQAGRHTAGKRAQEHFGAVGLGKRACAQRLGCMEQVRSLTSGT
eukprot:4216491-Alexandrium_andersonii.AAC.1